MGDFVFSGVFGMLLGFDKIVPRETYWQEVLPAVNVYLAREAAKRRLLSGDTDVPEAGW